MYVYECKRYKGKFTELLTFDISIIIKNRCQYIGTLLPPNEFIDPTCIVYSSIVKYVYSLYIFFQ